MFAQGDLVVYGGEGVCRVEGVGTPAATGIDKTKMYYTLAPLYRTGQVMTPVDTGVLMRPVMTKAEAAAFLGSCRSCRRKVLTAPPSDSPRSITSQWSPPTTAAVWPP